MERAKAIIVILLILGATGAGIFVYMSMQSGPPAPLDQTSPHAGEAYISEVHMNQSLTVDEEFFEIYFARAPSGGALSGLYVTTFDEEGMLPLPDLTGITSETYIAIFSGSGTDDLELSDGRGEIHLSLEARILDPSGDEIGLFDSDGYLVHFMRYGNGNGDSLYGNWPAGDSGLNLD